MSKAGTSKLATASFVKCFDPLLFDIDVSALAFRLWLVIERHRCGRDKPCYPGLTRLAKLLGVTRRHVISLVRELEEKGYLKAERRPGRPNLYAPCLPVNSGSPVNEASLVNSGSPTSEPRCTGVVNDGSPKVDVLKKRKEEDGTQPPVAGRFEKTSKNPKSSSKKAKPDTDPGVAVLIKYFCGKYLEKLGAKYTVTGGKDGQAMKILLKDHSAETLQRCVDAFLADLDPWLDGKRSIGVFRSRINSYIQKRLTPVASTAQTSPKGGWFK
jgi:hypothetical protein